MWTGRYPSLEHSFTENELSIKKQSKYKTETHSHLEFSEEIERSILYYKIDKKILRLNMFGATSCKSTVTLTEKRMRDLDHRFPEFVDVITKGGIVIVKVYDKQIKRVKPT